MNAEVHDLKACEVSLDEAKAELARLLADSRFRVTERQKDILRYLAEHRFEGCEEGVKAYSIALDVLGRPSGFDASTDPIVRIEISRLRSALDAYYQAFGLPNGVTIHIPKGMYTAIFPAVLLPQDPDEEIPDHHGEAANVPPPRSSALPAKASPPASARLRWQIAGIAATALVLGVGGVAGGKLLLDRPGLTEKPTVYIQVDAAETRMQGEASQMRDSLLTALTQFATLTVAKAGYAHIRSGTRSGRSYEIAMKYYGDADDKSVWWQIVDSSDGDLLKSGVEKVEISGKSPAAIRDEMAGDLARLFASTRGVINNIEIHGSQEEALGNACVLRAEYALDEGGTDRIARARNCLESSLAEVPGDPDATALLSRVVLAEGGAFTDAETRRHALDLAKGAVSAAPLSDRAQLALMSAQFAAGRIQAAIQAGNRAVELNPNNGDAAAKLSVVLYSAGYREAGVAMARDTGQSPEALPRDAILVLALDAYGSGHYSEASLLAEQINCTDFMVSTIRTAALGQLSSPEAAERMADIRRKDPDFESTFRQRVASWRLQPEIASGLEAGLVKAGAQVDPASVASVSKP